MKNSTGKHLWRGALAIAFSAALSACGGESVLEISGPVHSGDEIEETDPDNIIGTPDDTDEEAADAAPIASVDGGGGAEPCQDCAVVPETPEDEEDEEEDAGSGGGVTPPGPSQDAGITPAYDAGTSPAYDAGTQPPGPSCTNQCASAGQKTCSGNGVSTCTTGANGCLVWGAAVPCGSNQTCDASTASCVSSGPACGNNCDKFSVILLPDTQYYTREAKGASNVYNKELQWIADHWKSENIKFVIHLGDITDGNQVSQWEVAKAAHKILDDKNLPYSMVTGNHDYIPASGETTARSRTHFGDYFGPDHFKGKSWYGGSYATVNNYTLFEVGHMKFLVMSLEYAARKESVCWAENIIKKYPDRHVIVATHCYLTHDGKYGGSCPKLPYAANGSRGTDLWSEFVSRHSNIFLVTCGHVGDSEYRKRTGNSKNAVHEMLVDYQFEKRCTESSASACTNHCLGAGGAGNGWLRQLIFDPMTNTVTAKTFTVMDGSKTTFPGGKPWFFCSEKNQHADGRKWYPGNPSNEAHQYSFSFDMNHVPAYKYDAKDYQGFNARLINATSSGQQYNPEVAMAPDGHFVAVWEDDSSKDDGEGAHDIFGRGFYAGGCADSSMKEFTVNAESAGDQRNPDIAMDDRGNFVVVWEDDKDGNGSYEIFMRGFNADGSEKFARKTVNTVSKGQQFNPRISMAPDGRFNVVWEDYSNGKDTPQIFMRGFNANGSQRFADINVMDAVEGSRRRPDVFLDDSARAFVTWEDDSDANGSYQIYARGFSADGKPLFGKKVVNSVSTGQQYQPAIGGTPDGKFTVVWADGQAKNGKFYIIGRSFNADGSERKADFTISSKKGDHSDPDICVRDDGGFTVVWADNTELSDTPNVFYRAYDASGTPEGDAAKANYIADGTQYKPGIGCTPNGHRVVVWEDDNDANGYAEIYGRGFSK